MQEYAVIFNPIPSLGGQSYCKSLIGDPHYNRYKLPLTSENWGGNWTLPGDNRPRMFVRVGPFNVPGRGYDRDAGWSIYVCGTDDTEMRLELSGRNMEPLAIYIYESIINYTSKQELRGLSFR